MRLHTLKTALVWLSLAGSALANGPPGIPLSGLNTSGGVPQLNAASQVPFSLSPHPIGMSTRTQFGGAITSPGLTVEYSPTIAVGQTSRIFETAPSGGGAWYALQFDFTGYFNGSITIPGSITNGFGEQIAPHPVTYALSIETAAPGITNWPNSTQASLSPPVMMNGQTTWTIQPGVTSAWTDPFYIYLKPGQQYALRPWGYEPIEGKIPVREIVNLANNEGSNTGLSNGITFASGNGTTGPYTLQLPAANFPVQSGPVSSSVSFTVPGFAATTIPSSGTGTDTCTPNTNGVASCSMVNATGAFTMTTMSALANGAGVFGSLTGGVPGGNQTQAGALVPFNHQNASFYTNALIGPTAVRGWQVPDGPMQYCIDIWGDSIDTGIGNVTLANVVQTDTLWVDYLVNHKFGLIKGAISGEATAAWAFPAGHYARSATGVGLCSRAFYNAGTNEFPSGYSLSLLINNVLPATANISALLPHGAADIYYISMLPRQTSDGTGFFAIGTGPYTAPGAGYGPGAVVNPTPLGGGYNTGVIGNGIKTQTIVGNGTVGPYTAQFSGPTMPGALWSDGAYTTILDAGLVNFTAAMGTTGILTVPTSPLLRGPLGVGNIVTGAGLTGITITSVISASAGTYQTNYSGTAIASEGMTAGGTSAGGVSTLAGSMLATGTNTPSTGLVTVTFTNPVPNGQPIKLYDFLLGPSARNAENYFLTNWALPMGIFGGFIDTAACVEQSPGTFTGSGSGVWADPAFTFDRTHLSNLAETTTLPNCITLNHPAFTFAK